MGLVIMMGRMGTMGRMGFVMGIQKRGLPEANFQEPLS